MSQRFTRRRFVKGSAAAAAVAAACPLGVTRNVLGANEQVRVAVAGIRSRGGAHINGHSRASNTVIAGLIDVDEGVLNNVGNRVEKKFKRSVVKEVDVRKMLDRSDIDVLSIATPNHWHSLMSIWAMQAGKDVYVEKPVSHNVWEGRQLVLAARKYKKVCQTGTQSRSSKKGIGEAVEFVQSGQIGKILYATGTCYKPRRSIGKLDKPLQIPDSINYDLWCGPAAKVDLYRPRLHYDWHWDFNTGNGDIGNQGIHQMDIARWFLGEMALSPRVMSIGGRLGYDDAGNTPNTQVAYHDYPKAPLIFEVRGLPNKDLNWKTGMPNYRGSRIGVIVQCEGGHVLIPNYYSSQAFDKDGKKIQSWRDTDPTSKHFANFIDCVRSRKWRDLNAEIEQGHLSSALCHTGNVSHLVGAEASKERIEAQIKGKPQAIDGWERMLEHLSNNGVKIETATLGPWLEMNPKTERFTNNDKANELLTRPYRKGFVVPDIAKLA